ncbi:hypothetical protein Tco_0251490 [Tanacetum coccineum]
MTFKVLLHHYGRFTTLPGRRFVDGMVATIDPVELESFSTNQMKLILTNSMALKGYGFSYLTRNIPKRFTTLYYMLPSNHTLSGLKAIKNDYDTNVMYDIAKVAGKLQIYAAHHPIDLSTVLIPNDGSLEKSFAVRQTLLKKLEIELQAEVTLANKLSCELTRVAEQMRIREIHTAMLHAMPLTSLNTLCFNAC